MILKVDTGIHVSAKTIQMYWRSISFYVSS